MATHSSILSWRMPWTEEPRGCKESDTNEHAGTTAHLPPGTEGALLCRNLPSPGALQHITHGLVFPGWSQPLKRPLPPPARKTRPEELPEHPGARRARLRGRRPGPRSLQSEQRSHSHLPAAGAQARAGRRVGTAGPAGACSSAPPQAS